MLIYFSMWPNNLIEFITFIGNEPQPCNGASLAKPKPPGITTHSVGRNAHE